MVSRYINVGINLLAFSPAIFIYVYVFPYFYAFIDIPMLVAVSSLPFVRLLVPKRFKYDVYPLSIITILLLMLATILYNLGPSAYYFLKIFALPLALSTFFSLDFALALILMVEGIFSERSTRMVGFLFLSFGSMLYELSIIAAMHQFSVSFTNAIGLVVSLDIESYYELFIYGYQKFLPMANFQIQVSNILLFLFIVSTITIVFSIYLREHEHQRERLWDLGYSMFGGAIVGALLFAVYDYFSYTQYQLSFIGFAILATFIVISRTSRKELKKEVEIKK